MLASLWVNQLLNEIHIIRQIFSICIYPKEELTNMIRCERIAKIFDPRDTSLLLTLWRLLLMLQWFLLADFGGLLMTGARLLTGTEVLLYIFSDFDVALIDVHAADSWQADNGAWRYINTQTHRRIQIEMHTHASWQQIAVIEPAQFWCCCCCCCSLLLAEVDATAAKATCQYQYQF